ncbi:hypothetical protein R5W24_001884 [Gemmata sp. JC717]|uniref:hypothetical protein n=1 Tax=Gemmata algarum TaxID=2975278 RepID=UPI0021BAA7B2|nr:hypothetical protein [Gemmata algarum]MDY3552795.1 hypothetical protein [Gemmata algarum]
MQKLLLAFAFLALVAGLGVAGEVTLVKFDKDKKEVTVKEGDATKTYQISEKTKFTTNDEDGKPKEIKYEVVLKGLTSVKAAGRMKFEIVGTKDGAITEAKMPGRRR